MSKLKANTIENVAGTETHSVDTMGIISGSNANGEYTKFPDGTLICTGLPALQTTDTQIGTSGIYRSATPPTLTFALPFITAPKITVTAVNTVNQYCWAGPIGVLTETNFTAIILSTGPTGQAKPMYQAIGRWK